MKRFALVLLLTSPLLLACGPKKPVTDWYYSSWVSMDGVAAKASFEKARDSCLAQSGVRDPASVEPGSATEREFIDCMEAARWCAQGTDCE